jgi:hypothetical protein
MNENNHTPINSRLLIFLLFINSLMLGFIKVYFKSNTLLKTKIVVIWLLIKAVIILLNVSYIKKNIYNVTHNKEYQTSSIAVIRNTHLMSCTCTFVAFLIIKV